MNHYLPVLSEKLGLNLGYFLPSTAWVAGRYVLLGVLALGLSVAFARLGGAELYGKYQFVLSVVSFLSILTIPGLNTVTLIAAAKKIPQVLLAATRICFQASMVVSVLVAAAGAYYLEKGESAIGWSLIAASILLPFFYGPNGWYAFYEGQKDFHSTTKRILFSSGLTTFVILAGLWQNWPLPALVVSYFGVAGGLTTYYYWEIRRKIDRLKPVKADIRSGIYYTQQKTSTMLPDNVQPLVISYLAGFEVLGIFMIAYALVNSASGLISALSATYFPLLLQYKKLIHGKIIMQNLALGILLSGGYFTFVSLFFIPLYGGRFVDSLPLAQGFSLAVTFLPLKYYLTAYFTAHNSPGLIIRAQLISYAIALTVFLFMGMYNVMASFIGYYVVLQLTVVLLLGISYYRRFALYQGEE